MPPSNCDCKEHACVPDPRQSDRYPVEDNLWLCAFCYAHGHCAPLRLHYAGLLP